MVIGRFKKSGSGFKGSIRTLAISIPSVVITQTAAQSGSSPDYRVYAVEEGDQIEIGAGWQKTSQNGSYVSILLDDPSWNDPLSVMLIGWAPRENFEMVWSRFRPQKSAVTGGSDAATDN